ncbi:MAG: TonB-dependent receptor [Bryobacteraceae bacterium]|nr:TonB-dependent receptor [Bryobacteraceae bacterium]
MPRPVGSSLLVALLLAGLPLAATDLKVFGTIEGEVRDAAGVTQMGASVMLYNRQEREVARALTGPDGRFRFSALAPEYYSLRVSLSSYVPALRDNILVRAGANSYLAIQLATIFSTIELVSIAPHGPTQIVSDDWKWVLRSANATRPVLRLLPGLDPLLDPRRAERKMFTATRGIMRLSAGDGAAVTALGSEPDLGTAFALATSLFGDNELHVSGNLGFATNMGTSATSFRTRYSRTTANSIAPDVELTVRQMAVRPAAGMSLLAGPSSPQAAPMLRTMSVKLQDKQQVTDNLTAHFGLLLESVVFLDRINLLSPFARLTYDLGEIGQLELGYSSGAPPVDLLVPESGSMASDLTGLGLFPRVSLREGRARVQRNDNYEVGFRKMDRNRLYSAAVYFENIRDAAMTVAAPAGLLPASDLLPDIASNASIFNLGSYQAMGYMASVMQDFGFGWTAAIALGGGDALAPSDPGMVWETASDVRQRFQTRHRQWAAARLTGAIPGSDTRIAATYMMAPNGTLTPAHAWLTQRWQPQTGLNIQVRQPIPTLGGGPSRWEMNAEVRNLLAQGYVPIPGPDGRSLYFVQFPRSLRGGLSFIF